VTTGAEALTGSGPNGGGKRGQEPSGISAAARVRASGEDFSASFHELQQAVLASCRRQVKWEAKVVAGIDAVLEFAAASPAMATALTVNARRPAFGERNPEQVVLAHFVGLLAELTPAERPLPVSTDRSIVESIAAVVRGHLLAGTENELPEVAPDLVYLALLPYLGLEGTKRWVASAESVNG
jgi:hypothetical protein